jgi:hypothetical protein
MLGKGAQGHLEWRLASERPELLRFCAAGTQTAPSRHNKSRNTRHPVIPCNPAPDLARCSAARTLDLFALQHLRDLTKWLNCEQYTLSPKS